MATGAAAYTQLREHDDGISQGLQFWGQMQNKENQDNRLLKERSDIRIDDKLKKFQEDYGSIDDLQLKVTGFDTFDQVGADMTNHAADEAFEQTRIFTEATKSGDVLKANEARDKIRRIKGSFKQVAEITDKFKALNELYTKKAQDGTMSGVDKDHWEAIMQSINLKNFKIRNDENGSPILIGIKENSDGSKEPYTLKYSEIINGDFAPYNKQNVGSLATSIVKGLGTHEELIDKGLITTKSQLWNPVVESSAKSQIKVLLGSNEVVADILNQIHGTTKREGFSDEEKKEVADHLFDIVKGGYKTTYEKTFNDKYGTFINTSKKNAEDARHNKATEANAREEIKVAAKNASANMLNALTAKAKQEHDTSKDEAEPYTVATKPFVKRDEDGKVVGTFSTITARNAKHEPMPIYLGFDKNGVAQKTLSVNVDVDKKLLTYYDGKNNLVSLSAKDNPEEYYRAYSSMLSVDQVNEDGSVKQAPSTRTSSVSGTSSSSSNSALSSEEIIEMARKAARGK